MQPSTPPAAPRAIAQRFGLSCASVTPFAADGSVDVDRLVRHLERCLGEGCDSFTLFGTTGEGSSVGTRERARVLDAVLKRLPAPKALVGVMAGACDDAVDQAQPLLDAAGAGVLLAPPSYFKGVGDEGLYEWFARVLDRLRDPRGVFLYHIPSVTQVPLSVDLIGRLRRGWPGVIAGVKDSGGEWDYTEHLLAVHGELHILVGDERLLARAIRHGGSGAINGFSNFCAARLRPMIERGQEDRGLSLLVERLLDYPVTPGVKALVAQVTGDASFLRTAPPLVPLPEEDRRALVAHFLAFAAA